MRTAQLFKTAIDHLLLRPLLCATLALPHSALAAALSNPAPERRPGRTILEARSLSSPTGLSQRPVDRLRAAGAPTNWDIFNARVFDEPLIPMSGQTAPAENRLLADALLAYADRTDPDDFSSLTQFVEGFPESPWRTSLLLHLGTEYYHHGYYSRALDAWEQGWAAAANVHDGKGKPQADRILGELARMYSKLGRMRELDAVLDLADERDLQGPATQLIGAAKGALWMMENKPDFCFKCGPLALERIQRRHNPSKTGHAAIIDARSGTNGFSLREVAELSRVTDMNYQMAFRSPGARFIVPSVVHWKLGHFAALVEREDGNGRLLAQDDTFGDSVWITPEAVEAEGSGYFLVPRGSLPEGWRAVDDDEGHRVWGKGFVDGQYPGATTPYDRRTGCPGAGGGLSRGMATYDFHALLASLIVDDTPVGYNPPVGPAIQFMASYHHREANQPATFSYSNLGPKWTCNWLSYITDSPGSPNADVKLYVDGGGTLEFSGFSAGTGSYRVEVMSQTRLVKLSSASYELQFADGSKKQYQRSDGSAGSTRRVFLSRIIDPGGNAAELNYDAQLRITNIVDAIGQATTLLYTNAAYPFAITSVTDPFGRTAHFQYNESGLLIRITDVMGFVSEFAYGTGQFMNALTTPYGTTTFASGAVPGGGNGSAFIQATDPIGQTERAEFYQGSGAYPHYLPNPEVPRGLATFNRFMDGRNSYYWDKKAYAEAAGNYLKARNYHWVHYAVNSASPIPETVKEPLENRVWYNYPGQPTNWGAPYYLNSAYAGAMNKPSIVARILDDGTTQLSSYEYNALGNMTKSIDPVGRTFSYVYATNNVDLLEVRMTRGAKNELLRRTIYNAQHLPVAMTDAAGQTTTNTYNARGQLTSTRNPLGQTTTFTYDTNGYLVAVNGPIAGTTNDLTLTYDSAGRARTLTFPLNYTLTYDYDALDRVTQVAYPDGTFEQFVYDRLDVGAIRNRLGQWTTNTYNAVRQLTDSRDPMGRITRYSWCHCGSPESVTDPMGRTTSWQYDLQGRTIAKMYPDGSTVSYEYDHARGLLKSKRDEMGQQTVYDYYPDNNLKQITYRNTTIPTPGVGFTYDSDYDRVSTMHDGAGTTQYSYHPISVPPIAGAGALQSVSGPLPNSIVAYQYDAVGRVVSRAINGVAERHTYDAAGRIVTVTNTLGTFQYSFVDTTPRVASVSYPNGQTNLYSYYGNAGDQRLLQATHRKPDGSTLSSFGYAYDALSRITSWTNAWDNLPSRVWNFDYDAASQLTAALYRENSLTISSNHYRYDPAGNRTHAALNGITNQFEHNALNQLISGNPAPEAGITYEWDGAHRLAAINQGHHRSEFSYDGLDRRVRIVEKTNGAVIADTRYLWCGRELSQARDANGTVLRRFFRQGETISGGSGTTNLFYTRDHRDSVREALDSSGLLRARFDYDPYGLRSTLAGASQTSFGFGGHFRHSPSGLNLTLYRAYDVRAGRWLSRDPLEELAGLNLYAYVSNDPVNKIDPTGECEVLCIVALVAVAVAVGTYIGVKAKGGANPSASDYGNSALQGPGMVDPATAKFTADALDDYGQVAQSRRNMADQMRAYREACEEEPEPPKPQKELGAFERFINAFGGATSGTRLYK